MVYGLKRFFTGFDNVKLSQLVGPTTPLAHLVSFVRKLLKFLKTFLEKFLSRRRQVRQHERDVGPASCGACPHVDAINKHIKHKIIVRKLLKFLKTFPEKFLSRRRQF